MSEDGLQFVQDIPIYGRIAALELFRPKVCHRRILPTVNVIVSKGEWFVGKRVLHKIDCL
jgi:hypothetical protein